MILRQTIYGGRFLLVIAFVIAVDCCRLFYVLVDRVYKPKCEEMSQ